MFNLTKKQILTEVYNFIKENPNCTATYIYKNIDFKKSLTNTFIGSKKYNSFSQIVKILNILKNKNLVIYKIKGREKILNIK